MLEHETEDIQAQEQHIEESKSMYSPVLQNDKRNTNARPQFYMYVLFDTGSIDMDAVERYKKCSYEMEQLCKKVGDIHNRLEVFISRWLLYLKYS